MKITYHAGPSGNKYCKITTRNNEFNYGIDGIRKGKRFSNKQRQELILLVIGQNVIRHTHVIQLGNNLGKLAKKTTEKVLLDLCSEGLIEYEQDDFSPNSVKLWKIKSIERDFEKILKQEVKNIITSLESYIQAIEKKFSSFNHVQKDYAMADLLDILHGWQPIIEIISKETKIKNEKRKFDSLVKKAYNILKKSDNRDLIDGRPFLRRLLHLKASQPMMNIKEFLAEIK